MENNNFLYPHKDREFFQQDDYSFIATEIVLSVLTIIGNTLVLLVYWSNRQKNNSQRIIHKYIISMALADLLTGIIAMPATVFISLGLPHNRFWCLALISLETCACMISVLALVATSTVKYMSLAYPIWFSTKFNDLRANSRLFDVY